MLVRIYVDSDLLIDFHWEQFEHPLYLPNSVPSDYHLFPQLKKELGGQHYQTREELISAVTNTCTKLGEDFHCKEIENLVTRYNKCLDRQGGKLVYTLKYVIEFFC